LIDIFRETGLNGDQWASGPDRHAAAPPHCKADDQLAGLLPGLSRTPMGGGKQRSEDGYYRRHGRPVLTPGARGVDSAEDKKQESLCCCCGSMRR
jgi:hypothetical protein